MSKMSQKEAVFQAVSSVLKESGISVEEGTNVNTHMTKELRAQVNLILLEGFKSGSIEIEREYSDSELKAYVSGLQSNWLRKDKRLNGGTSYIAKNPGSRVGSSDPQLKTMRILLSTLTTEAEKAEVQSYIDARINEINAVKVKKANIDYNLLPADLAAKFQK
jgi:hypothetical protein